MMHTAVTWQHAPSAQPVLGVLFSSQQTTERSAGPSGGPLRLAVCFWAAALVHDMVKYKPLPNGLLWFVVCAASALLVLTAGVVLNFLGSQFRSNAGLGFRDWMQIC